MSLPDKSAKIDASLTASFYEKHKKIALKIMNTTEELQQYSVKVEGVVLAGDSVVDVASSENHEVTVVVRVPPESGKKGVNTIYFDVKAMHRDKITVHEKTPFPGAMI